MSTKETGGPAFPCSENGTSHTTAMAAMLQLPETASTDEKDKVYIQTKANAIQGASLRDYFAAKVVQGLVANPGGPIQQDDQCGWRLTNCTYDDIAEHAYRLATAMLAVRGEL